jgi:hypothetical protein
MASTDFSNKCKILGELWMDYRDQEDFEDFTQYNDLGLPLAFFIREEIVKSTPQAEIYINETFDLFILSLGADPNENYESLQDLLVRYGK